VDGTGRIYVIDFDDRRVVRVNDMTGTGWTTLGGTGKNQFESPRGIFVDRAGRIYVADFTRIVRVNDMNGSGWTTLDTPGTSRGIFVR
jgi:DNA-binding beta-propeller fold protein YncE